MPSGFIRAMPVLFVLLWSTGFIGAGFSMPYAEPFGFLALRFGISFAVLLAAVLLLKRRALPFRTAIHAMIAGALLHGIYLGMVFWAIHQGFPSGLTAVIVSLQPLLVAGFAGALLGEVVAPRQWAGIALGFLGTILVVAPKLGLGGPGINLPSVFACICGLIGISAGTLWQKRFVGQADLLTGTLWQYLGATLATLVPALLFEHGRFTWNASLVLSLLWLVFALSLGAIFLLMAMIRRGEVSKVSSLFYLVPAVTALMAFILFGETLSSLQLLGMAVSAAGVALATVQTAARRRASR